MNKLKLFLDNLLIYGLGGVIGKIIPLIMVPVVTRLIPDTSYYGISDLSNTLVSLASSFCVSPLPIRNSFSLSLNTSIYQV